MQTVAEEKINALMMLVKRSHLVSAEDKDFLLENAARMPEIAIEDLTYQISVAERNFEKYVGAALEADTEGVYFRKLQDTIKKAERTAFQAEEKASGSDPEEFLNQQLNDA